MTTSRVDVETLIIGAGVIGSSVAMHLAKLQGDGTGIRVVDFDLEGVFSSSELNAGGVRATWNQPINIESSKVSIEYFDSVAAEVGYRPCGYLWLHRPETWDGAAAAAERTRSRGWEVRELDRAALMRQAPFIDKTDDLAGALFAPRDGLINPNLLKKHYRDEAKKAGVEFDDAILVKGVAYEAEPRAAVVQCQRFDRAIPMHAKGDVLAGRETGLARSAVEYRSRRVVNCAGPWAFDVARMLKYACPSHPVRRQVCIFDSRDVDLSPYGMIVDASGVYFHPEATNGLAGFAIADEQPGVNFDYDGEAFFNERIWPSLFERSTKFERLKHLTGWAGLYEVSPDESAIVGQVESDEAGRQGVVYEAHSFSGHGVMHSYAAGRALAELLARGRYETLDFSALSGRRFDEGKLIRERLVI